MTTGSCQIYFEEISDLLITSGIGFWIRQYATFDDPATYTYNVITPTNDKAYNYMRAEAMGGEMFNYLWPRVAQSKWWHDYVMRADEIRFLRGRLRFGNATNSAPFPSAVIVFRRNCDDS